MDTRMCMESYPNSGRFVREYAGAEGVFVAGTRRSIRRSTGRVTPLDEIGVLPHSRAQK